MRKNPENTGVPERLSEDEVQRLIDQFPENEELLRHDFAGRLEKALELPIGGASWFNIQNALKGFAFKIFIEELALDHIKTLPLGDQLLNFIDHYRNNAERIQTRMAEILGYSIEIMKSLHKINLRELLDQ